MKLLLKILKWIGKIIAGFIILLLISGLCFRLFSSKPVPPGKLVDVNGTKLHIRAEGEKNNLPTLILELGMGGNTDSFHWIAEGLKKNMRVVRYDREGSWYSESSKDSITPEFYANQLHQLLEKSGEKPPYIIAGHSLGGSYIQIFRDLYPNDVKGLIFIDSTHPNHNKNLAITGYSITKNQINLYKFISIIADIGIIGALNSTFDISGVNSSKELPEDCKKRFSNRAFYSGKIMNKLIMEIKFTDNILLRSSQCKSLDSLPTLIFTATEKYSESKLEEFRKRGIYLDKHQKLWLEMQKELEQLSTKTKQLNINGSHSSIIAKKENADIINKEILLMAETIN
jgi:predicted alpha/beta hydrolase family esterase